MEKNQEEISKSAVLVNLSVRTWAANILDRTVSRAVAETHGTDAKAGRFWKTLVPKKQGTPLGNILAIERAARTFHAENTLPWMHDGMRILPTSNYATYMEKMRGYKADLEKAVAVFVNDYDSLIAQAKESLKTLFREDDYPTRSEVISRFGLSLTVLPMPKTATFEEANLGDVEVERITQDLTAEMAVTMQRATEDLWSRLYACVTNLHTRLDGDPQYLREGVLDNANELLDLLPRLNITNDEKLEQLSEKLRSTFKGMTANSLRQDVITRSQAADEVAAIESMMSSFMGGGSNKMGFMNVAA